MTVRFKCQSEYQKSYGVSRSRSVSPRRCAPLAGMRSDQMGISREPGLQRRRRLDPGGLARSCSSLLCPPDPQSSLTEPHAHRTAPPAGRTSRSRSARRKEPKPPAEAGSPAELQTPAGPRPAADPGPSVEPGPAGKSAKPHPSNADSQPQLSRPVTAAAAPDGQQLSANEHALRWRAGLRSGGQRSGSQRSEYLRQFSWKKATTAASPLLTAEQVLHSVPAFQKKKKNPVSLETEYQRSFQGLAPPTEPRLRKHLEHQRVPLFHTHTTNKRREETEKKPRPKQDAAVQTKEDATPPPPPPPQVHRGHRIAEEGGAGGGDTPQVKELRQKALSYRRRAWGANFSRDHLSQLLSEHNALWEPTDTADSPTDPPTPRLTFDLCQDPDGWSTSHLEALDLASRSSLSSRRSSATGSGGSQHTNKHTQIKAADERRTAWEGEGERGGEEDGEGRNTDEEEGRLPTPRLKMLPVQRTHHDLTTPATGGAILVGKPKSSDDSSPSKQQRCGSAVSMAAGVGKEAWPENNSTRLSSSGPSPDHRPAGSPPSKPIRMKPPSPVAPPPVVPPPHCIHGTLRHPDFQHNGELGLRFRELPCSGGGCGSDEDDRLSVMSWRSAASCSMASAVLERAQKRRENFWGKR